MSVDDILIALRDAVVEMEEDLATEAARNALAAGIDVFSAINNGLVEGMRVVGQKYAEGEYFIPEVLLACDAMNAGLDILKPHLKLEKTHKPVKVVLGVVQGDTHDIGKNLVKVMVETGGFEVHDLGRDVPLDLFVEKALEVSADVIGLSTLMTTTMEGMRTVIRLLEEKGVRDRFKVIIGGGPISLAYANEIAADGYAPDANAAVHVIKDLLADRVF